MNFKDVKWVVDEYLLEDRNATGDLHLAFQNVGVEYYATKYVPMGTPKEQDYGPWSGVPIVLYGTWGWIKKVNINHYPGAYGCTNMMDTHFYYPQLPVEWLLNADYFVLPFGELLRSKERIFRIFGDNIFLRPLSGGKTFAGFPVTKDEFEFELNSSMQLTSVTNETLVMIAKANPSITGEYRFIIGQNEVIAGSQYRYMDKLDIRRDYPEEALKLAKEMARHEFQPDTVYTCDIATLSDDSPKIIELNSFSCAGLYACDKETVIRKVSEIAISEWED